MTKSNRTQGGETELEVGQREKMGREKIREEGKDLLGPSWVATQNKRGRRETTRGTNDSNI